MKSVKTMMGDAQMSFAFVGELLVASWVRAAVLSLNRYCKDGSERVQKYQEWLMWHAPLNGL